MPWRSVGTLLMGLVLTGAADPASACIFTPPLEHRVDAALHARDQRSPEPPTVLEVDAFRRQGMTCTRANCVMNSCGNTGTVRIDLAPSAGEATPPEELGYRLILVRGELPPSLRESLELTVAAGSPMYLRPGFDEMPALDVTLAAVAVDAAGNESAPTEPFDVRFDGCTLAAVGDRCEDELEPETDLSAVFEAQLDGAGVEPEGFEAGGASCTFGPGAGAGGGAGLALAGLALAAAHSRRRARWKS